MATDGQLPNGHRNTARAYADAICAFPDEQFKRSDLQPPLQSALDDLKETPVIAVVDQVRTCEIIENIYEVTSEALEEAESTVATRDPVCPCGHSGLRNQGDHYQCGFRACDDQFDRNELGGPIARPDGGHGPVDAAGAEAERAVAEHCGIAIDDVRVRHTRESHPGAGIEALERLVLEWVDRESGAQVRTDGGRPEHQAVDGWYVCGECGAIRKTALGMVRHRAREERR